MIRRMGKGDLDAVAAIWLDANREAHDFIPAAYWLGHFAEVRTALAREEGVDPETGEAELLMEWRWDGPQS